MSKTIYKDPNRFYIYTFLREDGTPYYVGKGTGNRAWKKGRNLRPTDDSRISIIKDTLTETEAFDEEMRLIKLHGRKDNGTGILRNLTDGGEGSSGYKHSPESIGKMSGKKHHMYGKKHSPEAKAKISTALSGEKNPNFGKNGTNNPMYGKSHTEKSRKTMSQNRLGNKNGSFGKKWFHNPETKHNIKCSPEHKPENYIPGRNMKFYSGIDSGPHRKITAAPQSP